MQSLTDLDLSFNQLRELPECLGALTGLVSLRAQYNQIERVHPGVSHQSVAPCVLGGICVVQVTMHLRFLQSDTVWQYTKAGLPFLPASRLFPAWVTALKSWSSRTTRSPVCRRK